MAPMSPCVNFSSRAPKAMAGARQAKYKRQVAERVFVGLRMPSTQSDQYTAPRRLISCTSPPNGLPVNTISSSSALLRLSPTEDDRLIAADGVSFGTFSSFA